MQHSKHTGLSLKRKITASLLSLAILGTGTVPLVSSAIATAAENDAAVGASPDYTVDVGTSNGANIRWVNAMYYDYLTDDEIGGTWRQSIKKAGTGFNGSQDEWYPYFQMNQKITAGGSSSWTTPLFFGNFCNTDGAYDTSTHHVGYTDLSNIWNMVTTSPNAFNFNYPANNSNGLSNYNQSYQGLVNSKLGANNTLQLPNGSRAPYFDASQLGNTVKTIKSAFPFTETQDGDVTIYEFDSTNAKDNVYFTWNGNTPTAVNYGAGKNYGVKDGIRYFMNPDDGFASGYGIFPFNTPGQEKTGKEYKYLYASVDSGYVNGWTNLKVYWLGASSSWPGQQMTWVRDEGNNKVFKVQIPNGATGFVLNNGSPNGNADQTVDGTYDQLKGGAVYVKGDQDGSGKRYIDSWPEKPGDAGIRDISYNTENLDYGFGINMDVKFRVPKGGRAKAANGTYHDIQFNFSGDDDLWMYITDETDSTKSPGLVLDMGGAHKESTGNVKFLNNKITATVDDVYGKGKDVKTFDFDYSHTYAMHIFYMERGMLESNCHMGFSMVPLGNNVIVNETINTTEVNPGLVDAVSSLKSFNFTPSQNGTTSWTNGLSYNLVTAEDEISNKNSGKNNVALASEESFYVPNFFSINDKIGVTQTRGESVLKYNTTYTYKNNTTGQTLSSGSASFEGADASVSTGEKFLSNTGDGNGDRFEFAELEASFVNTPVVGKASVTKKSVDFLGNPLTANDKYGNESFSVTALVNILGDGEDAHFQAYDLSYDTEEKASYTEDELAALPVAQGGTFTIKNGETVYFPGLPENAQIKFVESGVDPTHFDDESYSADYITVGEEGNIEITNPRDLPANAEKGISVSKQMFVDGHETVNGATLGDGYTFTLKYGDTVVDTKTITAADKSTGNVRFKKLIFTCDEQAADVASGIFYVDPDAFANETDLPFPFTVEESLTNAQGQFIYQPDPIEVAVYLYYDKVKNELTTEHPVQDASLNTDDPEFFNYFKTGAVNIHKTVAVNEDRALTDEEKNKEFTATVSFEFPTGTVGANTFPNGVPFYYMVLDGENQSGDRLERLDSSMQITLKHDRTIVFDGLPVGTRVKVTETPDSEYAVTYDPTNGQECVVTSYEESEVGITLEVTNTKQQAGSARLGIRKALTNDDVAAKAGLTVANAGFKFRISEVTLDSTSDYTETVTGTGSAVYFSNIPFEHAATRTFMIEELPYEGSDPNVTTDTTVYYAQVKAVRNAQTNAVEIAEINYLKDNETIYTVRNTGTINVDDAFPAVFTNEYQYGSVSFTKQVVDASGNPVTADSESYTVKVELQFPGEDDYVEGRGFAYNTNKVSRNGNVTVQNGSATTIERLPVGTKVRVTEIDSKGAVVSYFNNVQELQVAAANAPATADALPAETVIYNQKTSVPVNLTAQKQTVGFELKNGTFTFNLDKTPTTKSASTVQTKTNKADGTVVFDTITYEVRSDGKQSTANNIVLKPEDFVDGTYVDEYSIYEVPGNNAFITYDDAVFFAIVTITATPTDSGVMGYTAAVTYTDAQQTPVNVPTFTNSWKKGSVEIKKVVKDFDGETLTELGNRSFKVNVSFTYPENYVKGTKDADSTVVTLNNANSFKATLNDLPYGATVSIAEDRGSAAGYTVTYNPQSGTVGGTTLALEVDNQRQEPVGTEFPVQFQKELANYTLAEGDFTFKLNGRGFEADTQQTNAANGLIDFGSVSVQYSKNAAEDDVNDHVVYLTDADFNADGLATLTYDATEVAGDDASIIYDGATIRRTVTIQKTVTDTQTTLAVAGVEDARLENGEPVDQQSVFVNRKVGPVSVSKATLKVDENGRTAAYETDQTFTAAVTFKLPNDTAFKVFPFEYQMSDVNGIFSLGNDGKVELKNHRTITFNGLPYGTQMKVVEDANANYTTAYSVATATVGGQDAEIVVTNTLQQPGQVVLPVTKTFSDNALLAGVNAASKGNKFMFRMVGDSSNSVPALAAYDKTITLDQYDDEDKLITVGNFPAINFPADFTYSADGTAFKFTVTEIAEVEGNDGNIVYDDATYEVTYTVRQTATGLDISAPVIKKGAAAANAVTFENGYKLGNVSVEKALEDFNGAALEKNAVFPVTLTATYPNGTTENFNGRIGFNSGKKVAYSVNDLPRGTTVTVEENDTQGMTIKSIDPATITIGETAQVITVTNKRTDILPAATVVEARKILKGATLEEEAFRFALNGNGVEASAVNDADGKVTFKPIWFAFEGMPINELDKAGVILLNKADFASSNTKDFFFALTEVPSNREDILFDDTTYVVKITVTVNDTLSELTVSAPELVNTDETGKALTFTNEQKGKATITKLVTQTVNGREQPFETNTKFDIDYTLTYPDGTTKNDTVTLGANETETLDNLPIGTVITVAEKDAKGFIVSYQPQSDSVRLNATDNTVTDAAVVVKNTRPASVDTEATLNVVKILKGDTLTDGQFRFVATGAGFAQDGCAVTNTGANATFPKITYKYTEGSEADDTENHIVYLRASDFDATGKKTLTYTITEDSSYNADESIMYATDPVTATVVITKTGADQVTLTASEPEYTADGTFINTRMADFSVTKVVKRTAEDGSIVDIAETDADYQHLANQAFTVKFFATIPGQQEFSMRYAVIRGGETEPMTEVESGVYGFTIHHGETLTLPALPVGTKVRFTEAEDSNYKVDSQTLTIGKDASANVVTLTNILQAEGKGYASVNKAFTPNAIKAGLPDTNANTYHFNLSYSGDTAGMSYNETVSIDGKNGWSANFPAITFPADLDYTGNGIDFAFLMKETAADTTDSSIVVDTDTFTLTYNVKQGADGIVVTGPVIKKNGTTDADTATFYNGYRLGNVTVEKALEDFDGAALTADVTFPVTLTATYPNGTSDSFTGEIGFKDGKKVTYTVADLPRGTTVSASETDTKGMTLKSIEPATVTIGETAQVITVTNKRTELAPTSVQLSAAKILNGADISKYADEFLFKLNGNGIDLSAKNDAQGKVLFDTVNFRIKNGSDDVAEENTILIDKAAFGTGDTVSYDFTITEIPADRADIAFDSEAKTVTVNVTKTETLSGITLSAALADETTPTFTNTKLGRVTLIKNTLDIDGNDFKPNTNFIFKVEAGGEVIDDNVIINVSNPETATYTTPYLPVGTVVTFTETDKGGFDNGELVKNVTVTDDTENTEPETFDYFNVRSMPNQFFASISVTKLAEGFKLSEGDFSFNIKGRGLDETVTNAADGSVDFRTIVFRYTKGTETDHDEYVFLHPDDFDAQNKAVLTYTITEVKGENGDVIYDGNTLTAVLTITRTELPNTFIFNSEITYPDGSTFTNPVRKGSATIVKKDQEENPVDGVEFTLFKVASDDMSREDVLVNGTVVGRKTTVDGEVTFSDLDLYVNDSQTLGDPTYQWYCFAETNAGEGHNLNSELTFFQLPQQGVYDVTYTYLNGKITTPTSGGEGMHTFRIIGAVLVILASLSFAGYLFFVRKPAKKSARHSVK